MFYEPNTWDPAGTTPWKRSNNDPLSGTFQGELDILTAITWALDPDARLTNQEANTTINNGVVELAEFQVPNLLPDG